ncbi:response regulator [Sediminispirochaeta bajacaliforniensis]|uniref:response regulator n=1 Tax=Sediminispirochaeta bajacaliforniensis TaxID=148 RepID=UPI0003800BD0|nr:response regulator transcription factor [Sediminispirochaeta bajacaliforniensis]
MAHETILVVDDEHDILELLKYNLEREGYSVITVETGEAAAATAAAKQPDLIILDLMLPGIDGVEVCKRIRSRDEVKDIPIIMLTAKSEDSDVISGLEVGADDYMTKPFSPKVLVARIRALLRRKQLKEFPPREEPVITIHDIVIDTIRHEVKCSDVSLDLSVTEFSILEFLARNPGWVFSRSQIIGAVKGEDYPVTERSVDVQILGLRKKLKAKGDYIETVRGVGYRMKERV